METLPSRKQVIQTLFETWKPEDRTEAIATGDALNRVLARDYEAVCSIPVVRASARDGVAVQSARFQNGIPDTSAWKLGEDFCRADTGDDFDDRFDAVIPIEEVTLSSLGQLSIREGTAVSKGSNLRPRGSMVQKGEPVGKKHRRLRAFDLASLAVGGVAQVEVYQKPRVAFLPTGSELIPLGAEVSRGKNIDSNSILAKNMLLEMGAEPICFPIVPDRKQAIADALKQALDQADVVILNGGSSKGEEDFNARLLEEMGVVLFHWVAAAPGKPMCVGVIDNKPVINLPGPPLAVLYGMDWCIRAIVHRLLHIPMPRPQMIEGVLTEKIEAPSDMEILCMMEVKDTPEGYRVKQKPWKGGSMADALGAGAYYITKFGVDSSQPGELLDVRLLRGLEDF
jgi:molybdopterin molybdotransferase